MSSSEVLDFEKICRLCLSEKRSMSAIFSKKKSDCKVPLSVRIMSCGALQLYEGDGLPASICSKCLANVNQSYAFREQCEQADNTLRQYLQRKNEIADEEEPKIEAELQLETEPEPEMDLETENEPEASTCTSSMSDVKLEETTTAYDYLHLEVGASSPTQDADQWTDDDTKPLAEIKPTPITIPKVKESKIKIPKAPKPPKQPRVLKPMFVNCEVCGKSVQRRKFKLHMMVHNGEKPHLCDTCGKSFTWRFALVTHKRVHSGEKPYLCKYCGQSFRSSSRFAEHSTIHTGRRSYVCEHCALAFRTSGRLKRHIRIHTGEKPYKCSFCDRGFSESYNLKQHLRLHTGEKPPHVCSICSQAFIRRKMLVDHLRVHHGITAPGPHMLIKTDSGDRQTDGDQDTKITDEPHTVLSHSPSVININITFEGGAGL